MSQLPDQPPWLDENNMQERANSHLIPQALRNQLIRYHEHNDDLYSPHAKEFLSLESQLEQDPLPSDAFAIHSCADCNEFGTIRLRVDRTILLPFMMTAVRSRASAGCSLFQLFLDAIEDEEVDGSGTLYLYINFSPGEEPWQKVVGAFVTVFGSFAVAPALYKLTLSSTQGHLRKSVSDRPRNSDNSSEWTFDWASTRLKDCQENHPQCRREKVSYRPSRLLRIPPMNVTRGQPHTLPLHISRPSEFERYAALSYCWGGETSFMLTSKNLKEWETNGIPFEDFPQTLKDAIKVTERLGILFLWIDAICILQDDENDKSAEIAKMGEIYMGAELTISAAKARKSSEGFLSRTENPKTYHALNILFDDPDGSEKIFISQLEPDDAKDAVDYRGWTLQERWLSPRLLEYRSYATHWVCLKEVVADGGSSKLPVGLHHTVGNKTRLAAINGHITGVDHIQEAIKSWNSIVVDFSGRQLSEATDKLLAISALASAYSSVLGDYLSGLWKVDLRNQLLWYVTPSLDKKRLIGRAPSWSWAVMDTQVYFLDQGATSDNVKLCYTAEIQNTFVAAKSQLLPFGEVTTGWLTVEAYFEEGVLFRPHPGSKTREERGANTIFRSHHPEKLAIEYQLVLYEDLLPEVGVAVEVTCIEILHGLDISLPRRKDKGGKARIWKESSGLVLLKKNTGIYERIGMFETTTDCAWCEDARASFTIF